MDTISIEENSQPSNRYENNSVVEELRTLLKSYLKKNPNITINSFCIKNNLASSTMSNLLSEINRKYVSPEVARKIVCGVNKGKTISFVLKNTQGALGDLLRKRYASLINLEMEGTYPQNIERFLISRNARLIMMLAHNKGGTTRQEIVKTLDDFALKHLDKMLAGDVLNEDENGIITGKKDDIYLNNDITKELSQDLVYFSKASENKESQIKILWGRLSEEKRKEQKRILLEAIEKIRELYSEEDSKGEPTFITIMADILKQPPIEGENK